MFYCIFGKKSNSDKFCPYIDIFQVLFKNEQVFKNFIPFFSNLQFTLFKEY